MYDLSKLELDTAVASEVGWYVHISGGLGDATKLPGTKEYERGHPLGGIRKTRTEVGNALASGGQTLSGGYGITVQLG